ncbi:4'-phosphopantetheinyl transferase superfamily protein [Streptomyces mobaraensis]|uniref:4'-phosphopantetheinyl transferase superfamily protein n=1 Tax=Streptomyces mobaraensis TaxID=35621 RepID=A0A5N5W918_STRMB|nr:4'-phosphopantetheinyl transferase superfamily protein [Streptomyces mobaraensis]
MTGTRDDGVRPLPSTPGEPDTARTSGKPGATGTTGDPGASRPATGASPTPRPPAAPTAPPPPSDTQGRPDSTPLRPRILGRDPLPAPWIPGAGTGAPALWLLRMPDRDRPTPREEYETVLDASERARAASFVRDLHRDRYVAAHLALRRLLGAYLDVAPAAVELFREPCPCCGAPHGRPAAAGASLHFNLSHAGELALLAFADTPVGADVEEVQPASVVDSVGRSLHPREVAELESLPPADRTTAFSRCWTRKEAYLKGTGTGLAERLSVTYVGCGPRPTSPPGWTLTDVEAPQGYTAAAAFATTEPPTA